MTLEEQNKFADSLATKLVAGLKGILAPIAAEQPAGESVETEAPVEHADTELVQEEWLAEIDRLILDTVKNPPPNKIIKGRRTTTYVNGVDERVKQLQDIRNDRINYRSGGKNIR